MIQQQPAKITPSSTFHMDAVRSLQKGQIDKGIELLKKALELNPGSGDIHKDLGTAYWQIGKPNLAETHLDKAVKLAPGNPQALNNFASFLMANNQLKRAEKLLKKAHTLKPDHFEILNNYGMLVHKRKEFSKAQNYFEKAIKAAPKWPNAYFNLGLLYRDQQELKKADNCFRKTLSINDKHALAWLELGHLMNLGFDADAAKTCYENALRYYPENEIAWTSLIGILEKLGNTEEAKQTINGARNILGQNHPVLALAEAKIYRREGCQDKAAEILERVLPALIKNSYKNANVYYELGSIYDRAGEYDKAFETLTKANSLHSLNPQYKAANLDNIPSQTQQFIKTCEHGWPKEDLLVNQTYKDPVFLVGFPRSGTTLLEQTLKSHPDIEVGEEKPGLNTAIEFAKDNYGEDFIQKLPSLSAEQANALRTSYFDEMSRYGLKLDHKVFVDKNPFHMHKAPLIKRIFPQAKFILALRHPCDCVLSCYMQNFAFNDGLIHFLDLKRAAKMYDLLFSSWEIYHKRLNLNIYTHHYEDLVQDFEPSIRKILNYLDLPWDNAVLEYDKTAKQGRGVYTPSYHQVTEKIYTRASGRWLNYRQQLSPVVDILAPWAKLYGYSMGEDKT